MNRNATKKSKQRSTPKPQPIGLFGSDKEEFEALRRKLGSTQQVFFRMMWNQGGKALCEKIVANATEVAA